MKTPPPAASSAANDECAVPKKRQRAAPLSLAAWKQFVSVAKPYWLEDQKKQAWLLLVLLIALMMVETQLAVMLNNQAGEMTSALAGKNSDRFWNSVRSCLIILAFAVPIYAFYYYMRDVFANQWRRWLTGRFLDGYLKRRKYYELGSDGEIDNPDQRISEDINTFTGRSIHFLLVFLGSIMQLVAFSAVLWSISHLLVGVLAVYALVGTVVALWVFGTPLIHLNFWQLRREADFRFSLMRLRENAESIAFYRGEAQERAHIDSRFEKVIHNFSRLIRKQRSLNLFQRTFSQLTLVLPFVILAEGVLSGRLEVGRAIQAAGAFTAVLAAVGIIVDNFESLSRFVAGIGRLQALSDLVLADGGANAAVGDKHPRIQTRQGKHLALEAVTLHPPQSERVLIKELSLVLKPGDALLITGDSGCGKSSLLRAIAGLWHTGSGVIHHPPMEDFFFLPQQPYLQPGTLRSQLIYPSAESSLSDEQLLEILEQVHLPHLAGRVGGLDAVRDWAKLLSVGEQQRLAFGRVLVHGPSIVILDEATSALDCANEASLYTRLRDSGTTLISIAHRPAVLRHHTHVLHLMGEGGWEVHEASGYRFDEPVATVRSSGTAPQVAVPLQVVAAG
ncbi:ABC transporter ATP-binding protein/permease [Pseudoduganella umbonata]|uniref:ABC transporter ATP-binding protein/permease n=1 Tax=Pseudoduganella umbonata TaxID=864828 RepID=A0A4V1EE68_9BURK|nr:ABC transporter ATP-binding protein/permease [Pseudoduganella umbonata]MBB3223603.1 putative ATP-binding cassette transporter [Pseudoduganella umbonata]QCP13531.1 ABC transporter ATP-binding protein/permease [Pseudoduganella umbonata]